MLKSSMGYILSMKQDNKLFVSHLRSPSLEERNTHSSLGRGSVAMASSRAFPTRPVPPVTITFILSPFPSLTEQARFAGGSSITSRPHPAFARTMLGRAWVWPGSTYWGGAYLLELARTYVSIYRACIHVICSPF